MGETCSSYGEKRNTRDFCGEKRNTRNFCGEKRNTHVIFMGKT